MTHAVVFFLIGLGIAFLPGADSRRRGSSTISQDPIQILPGDYHFANKVNSSCLYRRQQYTNPEFLNAINTIRMLFNDLRKELVGKNRSINFILWSSINEGHWGLFWINTNIFATNLWCSKPHHDFNVLHAPVCDQHVHSSFCHEDGLDAIKRPAVCRTG